MKLKRILLTACLLLVIWPCLATAKEEPILYTVKDGDTLWDISQRFIKDPHYWPNLWSNNPDIGNPHLIYPGQQLRIYDGRIEIVAVPESGAVPGEVGAALITPEEVLMIPTYGGGQSYISTEEDYLGTLVDTVDNRLMVSVGDTVFLEMEDLNAVMPGDVFELVTAGPRVVHPSALKNNYALELGFQTIQLGIVEVTEVTPTVAVATITSALREIKRGARLIPYRKLPDRIPRIFADRNIEGFIISDDIGKLAMGQWEVILLDVGSDSGLQVGHELAIYRQREETDLARRQNKAPLRLPDIDLGDAIVLEVRKGFAEALILRTSNQPIYRGDRVRTKTE